MQAEQVFLQDLHKICVNVGQADKSDQHAAIDQGNSSNGQPQSIAPSSLGHICDVMNQPPTGGEAEDSGESGRKNLKNKRSHKCAQSVENGANSHAMLLFSASKRVKRLTPPTEDQVNFDSFFANAPQICLDDSSRVPRINKDSQEPDTPVSFDTKRRRLQSRPNQHIYQGRPPE